MEVGYASYSQIRNQATDFLQDDGAQMTSIVNKAISTAYTSYAEAHDWRQLRRVKTSGLTFNTGSAFFYCPSDVDVVVALINSTTIEYLEPRSMESMAYMDVSDFTQSGWMMEYGDAGDAGRTADFHTAAELLTVESSSSSDTSIPIRLVGLNSSGDEFTRSVSTNSSSGTTAVSSSDTFTDLFSASTSSTHAGTLIIKGATSAITYARIAPDETTVRYKRLRINQQATTADNAVLIYKKAVRKLVNDDDIIEIPISTALREMAISVGLEFLQNWAAANVHKQTAGEALQVSLAKSLAGGGGVEQSRPMMAPRSTTGYWTFKRPGTW